MIPPFWAGIWGCVFASIYFGVLIFLKVESKFPKIDLPSFEIIIFILLIHSAKSYELQEEKLIMKFFSVPIRKIGWSRFSGVAYIPRRQEGKKDRGEARVMLTISPCKPFDPSTKDVGLFLCLHPIKAIKIRLLAELEEQALEIIQQYVGTQKCFNFPIKGSSSDCV